MEEQPRSTEAGAGYSDLLEAYDAGAAAAAQACAALAGPPSFCLVFATIGHDPKALLAGIRSVVGGAVLAGCSGEGVISGSCSNERRRAVTVLAVRSLGIRFSVAARDDYGFATEPCARALAAELRASGDADLKGVIVLTDGLLGDCTRFLATFQDALPAHTTVVGGCAADDMSFERTYQYAGDEVLSAGVVAVAIRGSAELRVAVSHGCIPIGLPSTITRARDGWILELDGRPAWEVIREYQDPEEQDLAESLLLLSLGLPLVPESATDSDAFVVRSAMALDRSTGAMFFPGGGLVEGERVRIMRRDADRIHRSAEQCARELAEARTPAFVLQFDCAGRGSKMFGNCVAEEVVQPLQRALSKTTAWVGLHTFGEIAPLGARLHYHNYTVALCTVYG